MIHVKTLLDKVEQDMASLQNKAPHFLLRNPSKANYLGFCNIRSLQSQVTIPTEFGNFR